MASPSPIARFRDHPERPSATVELDGERCTVPTGITVLQAYWYTGRPLIHGAGCLGGACGACTTTYRLADNPTPRTGLGCQIPVVDGMSVNLFPIDPPPLRPYRMADVEDPAAALFTIYPETRRCTLCDACTTVCPQDIPVRQTVRQMMHHDFEAVAPAFDECVMCGFCTMVCEVGIAPNLLGMYARKAVAAARPSPPELVRAQARIRAGEWQWEALLDGDPETFPERCRALILPL